MKIAPFLFASHVLAARPFLDEPDTGLESVFGDIPQGSLPELDSIAGLPDFQWAARNYLPLSNFTYYRNAAGGEWSYRNNLEVFSRYPLRPRFMRDVTKVNETMQTSILGYNFSAPFFMSPAARAGFGHPDAERNLVRAAADQDILYIVSMNSHHLHVLGLTRVMQPSLQATLEIEEITAAKSPEQITFQQVSPSSRHISNEH